MKNNMMIVMCLLCGQLLHAQGTWTRLLDQPAYGLSINPKNPNTMIVGGLGRTLYRSHDAGRTWSVDSIEFRSGSSQLTNVLISSKDTNIVLIGGVFNSIRRSTNQGRDWETVFETEKPQFLSPGETIMEMPNDANIIYAGDNASNRVFRSLDLGLTWDTLGTLNVPSLCTIAFRTDSSNIMYAGCKTGIIERSTDAGITWNRVTILRNFQDAEIPKIVFSKKDPLLGFAIIAYFLPGNIPNGGVFKTTDGGYTWNEHSLRDTSFWSICFADHNDKDYLFLGGFSDANDVIPGPGLILKKNLASNFTRLFDNDIPWFTNPGGTKPRRNVWMMRSIATSNEIILYAASEAGLYRYAESIVSVEEHELPLKHYAISGLTIASLESFQGMLHLHSMNGLEIMSGRNEVHLREIPDGVYLLHHSNHLVLPMLLMKVGQQLFPHFGN